MCFEIVIFGYLVPDLITDDLYPSKRVLAWSPDCSIFAIATSHGHIAGYDLLASNLFVIESVSNVYGEL